MLKNEKGQAVAPKTVIMTKKDFEDQGNTRVYWLGGGGAMINDRGTVIMIDPLLEGFDMPLLIDMPIDVKDVPHRFGKLCFVWIADSEGSGQL